MPETIEAEDSRRKPGRPSLADYEAREAALAQREAELRGREEAANALLVAARSGAARSDATRDDTVRSEPLASAVRSGRKRKGGQIHDQFEVDLARIPKGMTYEWKRATVLGQGSPQYDVFMREQGFEPVPASRHPEMVIEGHKGAIIRDGLILMERPEEYTREAQAEDRRNARLAVTDREKQIKGTPDGQLPRERANGTSTVELNRYMEPGAPAGLPVE